MVESGDRGIDYFSRGVNEIIAELKEYPGLEIEKNLVLQYDRDFKFYLSARTSLMKPAIEEALTKAKESGMMDRLVNKYWANDFAQLNYTKRIVIRLQTPK